MITVGTGRREMNARGRQATREEIVTVQRILEEKGRNVTTSRPEETLSQIATTLSNNRIGAVVIVQDKRIAGILSERDIVRAIAGEGPNALGRAAHDFMTEKVVTCETQETIDDVMQKMSGGRFRHLPVVEGGELVGIISIGDVVKRRIAEAEREAEEIREYITSV